MPDSTENATPWIRAASLAELRQRGRMTAKLAGHQIALFAGDGGEVWACDNRCPHEGYPLVEGHFADGCILTCNWHNWKFDLKGGETLVGGDTLRRYPVRTDGDDILVDLADPPPQVVAAQALAGLRASFDRHEYTRMAREIARLQATGTNPLDAVRETIGWTYEHFEYGTTHAVAAAADWLALRDDHADDPARALTALTEIVGHFAWDSRLEPAFPYPAGETAYDAEALVRAIEDEDEAAAVALIRGGVAAGLDFAAFEPALSRASLAHYQDFGHALIYVYKTGQLAARLDGDMLEPLLLMLTRSLIYASREDLIPEFKAYAGALASWDDAGEAVPAAIDLRGGTVAAILERITAGSANPEAVFDAAMDAAAWQMAHYDMSYQNHVDKPVSRNVGWLSFTHTLTFGNAVRKTCEKHPALWPAGLLQIGCFLGRNAGFVDAQYDPAPYAVADPAAFLADQKTKLFDHGNPEFIVSCHLVKLLSAMAEEIADRPDIPWRADAVAAVNRFLNEPLKRKHALRAAHQALAAVK